MLMFEEGYAWNEKEKLKAEYVEVLFSHFFSTVLDKYREGQQKILGEYWADDLEKLWFANIKASMFGKVGFAFYWKQDKAATLLLREVPAAKDKLIQHGKENEPFWFAEKNFEKLIETFENCVEQYLGVYMNLMSAKNTAFKLRDKLGKSEVREILEGVFEAIKKANKSFIKDLQDVRAKLKENLRGRWYWLKVGLKFATVNVLPWMSIFLITLFGLLDKCKCNGG